MQRHRGTEALCVVCRVGNQGRLRPVFDGAMGAVKEVGRAMGTARAFEGVATGALVRAPLPTLPRYIGLGQSDSMSWDSSSARSTTVLCRCPAVPRVWRRDTGTRAPKRTEANLAK